MLMKPDRHGVISSAVLPIHTVCSNCGIEDRRLLHHVPHQHRWIFCRLCTTCFLRLHPQCFCPTCFQVYPPKPSNDAVVTCSNCYSSSHAHCVTAGQNSSSSSSPYVCPLCVSADAPIFNLKRVGVTNIGSGESMNVKTESCLAMDRDEAKKLLAAAKIASVSMNKAAVEAKTMAEFRANEAARARKRAKEALAHVAQLVAKKKYRLKEEALARPGDLVGRGVGGVVGGVSYPGIGISHAKMEPENNVSFQSDSQRNGKVVFSLSSVVGRKNIIMKNVDRVDNSNQVLAASTLNAVELRENVDKVGIPAQHVQVGVHLNDAVAMMDADENSDWRIDPIENVGEIEGEMNDDSGSDCLVLPDVDTGSENLNTDGEQVEDVNKDAVLAQTVMDGMPSKENGVVEHHANGGPM